VVEITQETERDATEVEVVLQKTFGVAENVIDRVLDPPRDHVMDAGVEVVDKDIAIEGVEVPILRIHAWTRLHPGRVL
jgi:hypothetical protein